MRRARAPHPRLAVVALTAILLGLLTGIRPASADAPHVTVRLTAEAAGDPSGGEPGGGAPALAWDGIVDGVVELADGAEATTVTWDLGDLGGDRFAGDLVEVEVVAVDGPGRLTVTTRAGHDRRAVLLQRAAPGDAEQPPRFVVQLGRTTDQTWTTDRPGPHRIAVRARAALADGTTVATPEPVALTAPEAPAAPAGDRAPAGSGGPSARTGDGPEGRAGRPVVIADGHVDIGPRIVDGRWTLQLRDDTASPPVWRDLSDVVLHLGDNARIEIPDRPAYAFLGAPGTPYHLAPQTQKAGIVWPGWNSMDRSVVDAVPGSITWRLHGVDGPGRFALFSTDSFGDTEVLFDGAEPLPQTLDIPRNSHVHGSWAFGAPGVYRLRIEMRAALASGQAVSDTRDLVVAVGDDTDPGSVDPGGGGGSGDPVDDDPDGPGVSISTQLDPDGGDDGPGGSGPGGSTPGTGGSSSGSGTLATTGTTVLRLLPVAAVLLAVGLALRAAAARRRAAGTT